ncbi:tetraacyldisaccharide 4'-kinase [Betaproteobacteria bacterium]|nr:tetraacyldisaccharide 4'-kinase [Betaproteobacteria bacterium]GHU42638.1 tetraacyldisaccharide 4'-kinase [Betaproteobacteria bacterium]
MRAWLLAAWCRREGAFSFYPALLLLAPFALLFSFLSALRRFAYRIGLQGSVALPVPVMVIGNITAGGAGKTPLVLALAESLHQAGWRPGIVSRGYGRKDDAPQAVFPYSSPAEVGDEPVLLATRSGIPVWVGRDRAAAGAALLAAHPQVDLLLCDDGLQHYRLRRDVEIAVFDGRGVGNGHLLPLGPLREPRSRLRGVDAIVFNSVTEPIALPGNAPTFDMHLTAGDFYRLGNSALCANAADFAGKKLHAVAGIGDPERFFRSLKRLGLQFEPHPFPDHHPYRKSDLGFPPGEVVLMTEKDGVKCATFNLPDAWVLPVTAQLPPALTELLLEKLKNGRQTA